MAECFDHFRDVRNLDPGLFAPRGDQFIRNLTRAPEFIRINQRNSRVLILAPVDGAEKRVPFGTANYDCTSGNNFFHFQEGATLPASSHDGFSSSPLLESFADRDQLGVPFQD